MHDAYIYLDVNCSQIGFLFLAEYVWNNDLKLEINVK